MVFGPPCSIEINAVDSLNCTVAYCCLSNVGHFATIVLILKWLLLFITVYCTTHYGMKFAQSTLYFVNFK